MSALTVVHVVGGLRLGGIESFLQDLTRLASKEGVRSVILAVYQKAPVPSEVSFGSSSVYSGHLLYGRKEFLGLIREIFEREGVKVVHSHLGELSGDILRVASECGIPVRLAHSHDLGGVGGMRWYLYRQYARRGLSTATHFSAVCVSAGRVFRDFGKSVRIIPAGVDAEKWKRVEGEGRRVREVLGLGSDVRVLLQVGRLVPEKNPLFSLRILKVLRKRGFPAVLLYAGEGFLRKRLEVLAKGEGLSGWVRFLGRREDIKELMSAADILLVPSLSEGLPRVLLEAWCVGLPFLLSDRVDVSDVFAGEYSLRVTSPETWAEAILAQAEGREISIDLKRDISLQGAWKACREIYGA
jgi:glycosyltransferase involved in cell wall biosynthesis